MPPAAPKAEAAVLDVSPQKIFEHFWKSGYSTLMIACFGALVVTIAVSMIILQKMRSNNFDEAKKAMQEQQDAVTTYLKTLEAIRTDREHLVRRQLREGKWPDQVKASWDDELRESEINFELMRRGFVNALGEDAITTVRERRSAMEALLRTARDNAEREAQDENKRAVEAKKTK